MFFKFSHFCFQNALEQITSCSFQELSWFLYSRCSKNYFVAKWRSYFTIFYQRCQKPHETCPLRGGESVLGLCLMCFLSAFFSNARKRRSTEYDSGSNMVDEVVSSDMNLNTFTTYNDKHRALIVRGVRKRLIITFPHVEHHLRDTRLETLCIERFSSNYTGQSQQTQISAMNQSEVEAKTWKRRQARENSCKLQFVWVLVAHWLRKWREVCWPITKQK